MEHSGSCCSAQQLAGFRFAYDLYYILLLGKTNKFQAAALWVSEAAIGVGYPEENKKGVYSE